MPGIVHNRSLELPSFDPSIKLIRPVEVKDWSSVPNPFIRYARLVAGGYTRLKEALQDADETFLSLAEHLGGLVLPHEWGFMAVEPANRQYLGACRHHPLIPDGYVLGAQVPLLHHVEHLTDGQKGTLQPQIGAHGAFYTGARWAEPYAHQFAYASLTDNTPRSLYQMDIEPLIVRPWRKLTNTRLRADRE